MPIPFRNKISGRQLQKLLPAEWMLPVSESCINLGFVMMHVNRATQVM